MDQVEELIAKIRANGHTVEVGQPTTEADIASFERDASLSLPPSYRKFVRKYGWLAIYDTAVNGIEDLLPMTEGLREHSQVPEGFVAISTHNDGAYCLDFSCQRPDHECPVVNYELSSTQHEEPVAVDFDKWLVAFCLQGWAEERF